MKDLKNLLKSGNTEQRRQVVEELRMRADESAKELLLEAMKDESWRVRKAATEILMTQFNVEAYILGVLSLLAIEDNAGGRNSAIDLLVTIGKPAIPYLIEAFNTDNHDVRKFVIDVIGEISDKRALPLLLNALKDEDENVKASAVEHLGKLKESTVVDALIEILRSGDIWTAYPAADALGRICDPKALRPLVEALDIKTLREPVLKSLACFSDSGTLDHIIPLLVSGSRSVKEEVLRTVNKFYTKGVSEKVIAAGLKASLGDEGFDYLMRFAWSNKPDVRVSAIVLLGILKDSRAVQPLLDMSAEEDFKDEIKRALIFIGSGNPRLILDLFERPTVQQKRFITEIAAGIGNPAFYDLFVTLLKDEDGHVRALAAKGLAGIRDLAAVEEIRALITDQFPDVQEAAVDALAILRDGLDRAGLVAGLSDSDPRMRKNCALLLGRTGDFTVVDSLGFVMKDSDVSVRKAAVDALCLQEGQLSSKYLMVALTDEVPMIRIASAYALGKAGTPESTDALMLLLSDPDDAVRVAAAKAIGIQAEDRAADSLIRALSDENGFVVIAAIETLGKMKSSRARDAIAGRLSSADDEIKRTAISALAAFKGMHAYIKPFLRDPDWATRKVAVEALAGERDPSVTRLLEDVYDNEEDLTVKKAIEVVLSAHR